jgi:hypothetical protein
MVLFAGRALSTVWIPASNDDLEEDIFIVKNSFW